MQWSLSLGKITGLSMKLSTQYQFFSCKFCEHFRNSVFTEHLRVTTSIVILIQIILCNLQL